MFFINYSGWLIYRENSIRHGTTTQEISNTHACLHSKYLYVYMLKMEGLRAISPNTNTQTCDKIVTLPCLSHEEPS